MDREGRGCSGGAGGALPRGGPGGRRVTYALSTLSSVSAGPPGYTEGLTVTGDKEVTAQVVTQQLPGLRDADFVLAAKLDALTLSDLIVARPKRSFYY